MTTKVDKKPCPRLFNIAETARALGCSRAQLYVWMNEGKVHNVKLGKLRRIPESEVLRIHREGL
jgi:excisionase family DNA binding protein